MDKARREELDKLSACVPDSFSQEAYRYARGVIAELLRALDNADAEIFYLRRKLMEERHERHHS